MPRTKKTPFPIWQTCNPDGVEKRYIRLGNSQLMHPAIKKLSPNAYKIYTYMLLESGGSRTFSFPYSKYKDIVSKQGFQDKKDELIRAGLIKEVQNNANLRKANIYEFTDTWKQYKPP